MERCNPVHFGLVGDRSPTFHWRRGRAGDTPSPMKCDDAAASVDAGFRKMNLSRARKHVFLCIGPDCCAPEQGLAVWEYLKQAVKTEDLDVMRTKAACFRVCCGGPWMLIYPEGVWYGDMTIERCERIVKEHLVGGRPVSEWVRRVHPLEGGLEIERST